VGAYDQAWIVSEEFLTVIRLVADRCAAGELEAIRLDGAQVIEMDAAEWLREHSREGDTCFKTGHVFLPKYKVLPVFLRLASLEKFIGTLKPPIQAAPEGETEAPAKSRPPQGGRPPAVDTKMVQEEIFRLMDHHAEFSDDDPAWNAQARLEEALEEFCRKTFKVVPSEPTIRRYVQTGLETWRAARFKT
jgi:hypothetical protein